MTPAQIVTQIKNVIQKMIEVGLSNQQNYPVLTDTGPRANEIGIAGAPRLSVSMKKKYLIAPFMRLSIEAVRTTSE
jgi:hypothetical protein